MPFTFSHPLFSAPLKRIAPNWLSVTGLVLGSMIPDMEYFMAMESYQTIGHSLRGFLLQGLPLSIALAFTFHRVVKPVLPKFLPSVGGLDQFAKHMTSEEWRLNTLRAWMVFLVSLLIGYWTHMFMDAWTHSSGVFAEWFPFLHIKINNEPLYQHMQIGLSLIGIGVPGFMLIYRYIRWREQAGVARQPSLSASGTKMLLWLAAFVFGFVLFAGKMLSSVNRTYWVSDLVVAPLSSALFGIFCACLIYQAAKKRKLAQALGLVALTFVAIVAFNALLYLRMPDQAFHYSRFLGHPPKGHSQALWNGYLWCWSAVLLLSSNVIGDDSGGSQRKVAGRRHTSSL